MRFAVEMDGACQPRSISPRYFASIRAMRRATSSNVSSRACRASRTAAPNARAVVSALLRRGNGGSEKDWHPWSATTRSSADKLLRQADVNETVDS